MNRDSIAWLAAVGVLVAGCSSSSGGDNGTSAPTPVAIGDVPSALAQAECSLITQCYGPAASLILQGRDCVSFETSNLAAGSLGDDATLVSSGKLTYDGTQVSACAAAFSAQQCDAITNAIPDACLKVFIGTTAVGGACTESSECVDDGVCIGHGMCPGACAVRLAAGSSCTTDDECARGLECVTDTTGKETCGTPATEGQACNEGSPRCGGALFCVGYDDTKKTPGTCKAASEVFVQQLGASCDATKGPYCVEGAFCAAMVTGSGATATLTYQCVGASSQGGPCNLSAPDSCPSGQYCNADLKTGSTAGTCTNLDDDGMPCDQTTPHCKPLSGCDGSACRPLQPNGGSCATGTTCFSGRCTNGMCAPDQDCLQP